MDIIQKAKKEIREIKEIQGATKVAETVILAVENYGQKIKEKKLEIFFRKIEKAGAELLSVRETEPLAQNAVKFIFSKIKKTTNLEKAKTELKIASKDFLKKIEEADRKIIKKTSRIIKRGDKIFTHCHSSLVELSLKEAKKQGKKFEVFNTETRPLFQGHITAKNLLKAKIPVTMVADSAAEFFISSYSGPKFTMDKVIIGADAILANGSIVNKVGSFGIGEAAFLEKIPLYVAAPLLKFYPGKRIKIEKRPAKEVWENSPKGLKIINFAFDIVPAKYITGIICEGGVIKPGEAKKKAREFYPWIK